MFNGEAASLNELYKTEMIRVPRPLKVICWRIMSAWR